MPSRPAVSSSAQRLATWTTRPARRGHRGLDLGDAQHREHARVERSGRQHDLVGLTRSPRAPRRWPARRRARCSTRFTGAPRPSDSTATWPTTASPPMSAFRVTGVDGGGHDPARGAEQPARLVERGGEVAERLGQPDDHQVAERVPGELAASRTGARTRPATVRPPGASATRLLRRSPGAGTPRSRRSRPDDPPSSATLTTAVIDAAYSRAARNVTASPCPPPSATTVGSRAQPARSTSRWCTAVRWPMPAEALRELLGDHDAAVPAAGAAERDRQVRLALALVAGQQQREEPVELVEELARAALREHVVADRRVEAGERAELLDPVRIRQEPAVEHEVDVEREPVLVAERHDVDLQRRVGVVLGEQLAQPVAQLVHVERRRVDAQVGFGHERLEQRALAGDAVADALAVGERMAAAALLVAADEHVVGRRRGRARGWSRPAGAARRSRPRGRAGSRPSARRRRARSASACRCPAPARRPCR